jgi:RES domain-containing protein
MPTSRGSSRTAEPDGLPRVRRDGTFFRVASPDWRDPLDTSYAKTNGGRWNPPGEFGALYLNATPAVAAANARAQHAGRAIKLFDLVPSARPILLTIDVPRVVVLDAATPNGIASLGFPPEFPFAVPWPRCQAAARTAHDAGLNGVAARSNAEATAHATVGEELALFEGVRVRESEPRRAFDAWYPDPIPG